MKTIWYKNWLGKWTKSPLKATAKNLAKVKKTVAENGVAEIFTTKKPELVFADI
jgi:hypothetical protein